MSNFSKYILILQKYNDENLYIFKNIQNIFNLKLIKVKNKLNFPFHKIHNLEFYKKIRDKI